MNEKISNDGKTQADLLKTISEKTRIGDKVEDEMRIVQQNVKQIEKIEYPGQNERKMLVSFALSVFHPSSS